MADRSDKRRRSKDSWNESAAWGREGRPRWRRWANRVVVVVAFLGFLAGCAYLVDRGIDWYQGHSTTTTEQAETTVIRLTITAGMTSAEIADLLEEKGVIDSAADFVDLVMERGTENALLPGRYAFNDDLRLLEVVDMLERGEGSASFKITIPEGRAISQTAADLTKEGHIPGNRYVELSRKPDEFELPKIGGKEAPALATLEGLLFPSTYWFVEGDGATQLIGAQLAAFGNKTADLPWDKAEALGVTPYEVVIVASLIEKEVSVAAERELVAAVIYNRLKEDMTLGIDATVRYALDKWGDDLTSEDLKTDSPYNTRVKKGLPPTPICNPGVAALEAALEPAAVDYLYYVLKDTKGNHFFTASYEEFLEAKDNQPE